jgi:integrase
MASIAKIGTDGKPMKAGDTGKVRCYRARVVVGHKPDGTPIQKMITRKTKEQVREDAAKLEAAVASGAPVVDAGNITARAFLDEWLLRWQQRVRPSTHAGYVKLIGLYIFPRLNGLLLRDATAAAMQRILDDLPTPYLKGQCRRILHIAFKDAVRLDLAAYNVMDRTTVPPHQPRQGKAWTDSEARRFLAVAAHDHYQPFWSLGICTGMRPSELIGLTWGSIDLCAGTLTISQAIATVGNETFEGDPKSRAGKRTLTLPTEVVALLRAHRASQNQRRLLLGASWQDHNLVCASAVGTAVALRNLNHRFSALCAKAGVPRIRPYDLRHSAISLLLAGGADLKAVSEVVGHSDPRLTARVYQHAYEYQRSKALADHAAALFGPEQPPQEGDSAAK